MPIKVAQPFERTGRFPIDKSMLLTKAEMVATVDSNMPEYYFAVCSDDGKFYIYDKSATPSTETGKWSVLEGGGGGSDGKMGEDFTTNIAVGGIPEGTNISKNDTIVSVLKRMMVTTYYPTFTAPSASVTWGTTLAEVGMPVTENAKVNFNAGAITLQGTKQNNRAGAATGYTLTSTGATTNLDLSNDNGTFNSASVVRATKGNVVITGTVDYAEGPQPLDSDGKNYGEKLAAGSVSGTKTIEFILPFYWGASDDATITDFTGLTKDLSKKGTKTYNYTTNDQYIVFAYDSSYGELTSILDQNGFETISGYDKSTITVGGQSFNVYVSQLATTDNAAANTFKF